MKLKKMTSSSKIPDNSKVDIVEVPDDDKNTENDKEDSDKSDEESEDDGMENPYSVLAQAERKKNNEKKVKKMMQKIRRPYNTYYTLKLKV